MDDFNIQCLSESKNEWISRLVNFLTPEIIKGFKSIFEESINLCKDNPEKYLMTFQNLISRIPKWNATIIETEKNRIIENTKCDYLEDLISCVHIVQLKVLTAMRVGTEQKKIDINIPKLDDFIHNVYISCARKLYLNVYLYKIQTEGTSTQQNNREIELIIKECILNTIRDNIPISTLLKVYLDETVEEVITEEIKEEIVKKDIVVKTPIPQIVKEETKVTGGEIITPSPQFTPQFTPQIIPQITNNIEPIESIKDIHIPPDNLNSLEEVSINSLLSEGTNNIEMPELIVDEIDFL
jgi:hypothetical protein